MITGMKPAKLLMSMALSLLVIACYAQGEKITVESFSSGIVKLLYKGQTGSVKVSIVNGQSETIFSESLKGPTFLRPYNLAEIGPGSYKLVIEDKDGKTEKNVSFAIKKVESIVDVSKIGNTKNKYLLSVENKSTDEIQVRVVDSDGNVLHDESITVNGKFAVVYNLDRVKSGLTFQVTGSSGVEKTFSF